MRFQRVSRGPIGNEWGHQRSFTRFSVSRTFHEALTGVPGGFEGILSGYDGVSRVSKAFHECFRWVPGFHEDCSVVSWGFRQVLGHFMDFGGFAKVPKGILVYGGLKGASEGLQRVPGVFMGLSQQYQVVSEES